MPPKKGVAKPSAVKQATAKPVAKKAQEPSFSVLGMFVRKNGVPRGGVSPASGGLDGLGEGYRPLRFGGHALCMEGELEAGFTMSERGRITVFDEKLPTAAQQAQRELDATAVRAACQHDIPVVDTMPVHYGGEWVCDDCESTFSTARRHCEFCYVDVCDACFAQRPARGKAPKTKQNSKQKKNL